MHEGPDAGTFMAELRRDACPWWRSAWPPHSLSPWEWSAGRADGSGDLGLRGSTKLGQCWLQNRASPLRSRPIEPPRSPL